jgi:hypothetical protein
MMLEMQFLARDRHKNVAVLNLSLTNSFNYKTKANIFTLNTQNATSILTKSYSSDFT